MNVHKNKIAHAIERFVENPVTNLVKGVALLTIGLTEASHTFVDDITHGHLRVGHGLVIIGLFGILDALPHMIEGLEASNRFLKGSSVEGHADNEAGPS